MPHLVSCLARRIHHLDGRPQPCPSDKASFTVSNVPPRTQPPSSAHGPEGTSRSRRRTAPRWLTHVALPLLCALAVGCLVLFGSVTALASCGVGDPLGVGATTGSQSDAATGRTASGTASTQAQVAEIAGASALDLTGFSSLSLSFAVRDALEPIAQEYGDALSVSFVALDDTTAASLQQSATTLPTGAVSLNGDVTHPSASMIKLAVLACLLDEAAAGTVDLQSMLEMGADDIVGGSGTLQHAQPGTSYTLEELAWHMIAESDNVATNLLINLLGMDAINAEATALGLGSTSLHHTMMDTVTVDPENNSTSSDDVARVLAMIATGTLVNADTSALAQGMLEAQTIDCGLDAGTPDGVTVAHKTGTIEGAIHDGGIVYAADQPYVLVVMTQGLEYGEATELIARVARAVYAAVASEA